MKSIGLDLGTTLCCGEILEERFGTKIRIPLHTEELARGAAEFVVLSAK